MSVLVQPPDPKTKIVDDWDFIFESGFIYPVIIDKSMGDKITFFDDSIKIHLALKPNPRELDQVQRAEDITIYKGHLLVIQTRKRDVTELTDAQKVQWSKTLQELTVQ